MPAVRNIRRSRRLTRQIPVDPEFEQYSPQLSPSFGPPSSSSSSSAPTTPNTDDDKPASSFSLTPDVDKPLSRPPKRSSHSRRKDPNHIPRPPNAFIMFRSEFWQKERLKSSVENDHRQISRIVACLWNEKSEAERAPYKKLAEIAKERHLQRYPGYKYAPVTRKQKHSKKNVNHRQIQEERYCQQVASLIMRGVEGDALEKEVHILKVEGNTHNTSPPVRTSSRTRRAPVAKKSSKVDIPQSTISAPPHSPSSSIEPELMTPELCYPDDGPCVDTEPAFVPTSEIPPLSLSGELDTLTEPRPYSPYVAPSNSASGEVAPIFKDEGRSTPVLLPMLTHSSGELTPESSPYYTLFSLDGLMSDVNPSGASFESSYNSDQRTEVIKDEENSFLPIAEFSSMTVTLSPIFSPEPELDFDQWLNFQDI